MKLVTMVLVFIFALSINAEARNTKAKRSLKGVEVVCGNSKDKAFPYSILVKRKGRKHLMTLAHGRKVVLRTYARKAALNGRSYREQYTSGKNFNVSLSDNSTGFSRGYLRAKFRNKVGTSLVSGTMACRRI